MDLDDKNLENEVETPKVRNNKNFYRKKMYQALLEFFKADMNIKNEMIKLKPTEIDGYDEESIIEYKDKLYNFLKETRRELNNIAQKFYLNIEAQTTIDMHFNRLEKQFLDSGNTYDICQDLYINLVSDMNEKFIEDVKDKCHGYGVTGENELIELINKANTVNELLHFIHSYIVNNDKILQAMPIIDTKENEDGYPITLYGEITDIAKKLYEDFPLDLECTYTDIISMKDKILMMIRGRGHALSIEIDDIDKENDNLIKYFLPKICNLEMVKKLPGINKISEAGATGMFISKKGELIETLYDFIEKVPTDEDIIKDIYIAKTIYNRLKKESNDQIELTELFNENDVRQIAMEEGEDGIRTKSLVQLQEGIKNAMKNLRKIKDKKMAEQKIEKGDNDDRGTRD